MCLSEIRKLTSPADFNALLSKLTLYCSNDEVMGANYLTKEAVASACGYALQQIAFDTSFEVTQERREDARLFLEHIAPELNSEEAYKKAKEAEEVKNKEEIEARKIAIKKEKDKETKEKLGCLIIIVIVIIVLLLIIGL